MKNPEPLRYYVCHQLFYFIFFTFINEEYFNSSYYSYQVWKELKLQLLNIYFYIYLCYTMNTIQNKFDLSEDRKLSFIKNSVL